jgi:hypothetical protein
VAAPGAAVAVRGFFRGSRRFGSSLESGFGKRGVIDFVLRGVLRKGEVSERKDRARKVESEARALARIAAARIPGRPSSVRSARTSFTGGQEEVGQGDDLFGELPPAALVSNAYG